MGNLQSHNNLHMDFAGERVKILDAINLEYKENSECEKKFGMRVKVELTDKFL